MTNGHKLHYILSHDNGSLYEYYENVTVTRLSPRDFHPYAKCCVTYYGITQLI